MLRIRPDNSPLNFTRSQQSFELGRLAARASKRLTDCPLKEIERIIHNTVDTLCNITSAKMAGWFFLSPSGDLLDIFHFSDSRAFTDSTLKELRELPWCSAHLNARKAIVLPCTDSRDRFSESGNRLLIRLGVSSLALLPFGSPLTSKRLLVLFSPFQMHRATEVFDQCALLESIFFLAYQRKLIQDGAEEHDRLFHQIFRTAIVGMAITNAEGRFLQVNKAFGDVVGYSEDELRPMRLSQLSETSIKPTLTRRTNCLHNAPTDGHQREQILLRKNGSLLWARITATLLKRSTNEDALSLITIEDITSQKTTHLELKRERKTLTAQLIEFQENERKRLSRELHDDIGQRLSLAASQVAMLQHQHSSGLPAVLDDRLGDLHAELGSLCTDLHRLSHSLHSYKLQHLGLKPALKDLCRQMSHSDFQVDLVVDDSEDPESKETSLCLYRVAQEALSNARRHAQTSFVAVTLTKLQHTFYMTIQDLGIGFETSATPQGLGLISMRERLKLINGQLIVHSSPGQGTEIWVAVPAGGGNDTSNHRGNSPYPSIGSCDEAA